MKLKMAPCTTHQAIVALPTSLFILSCFGVFIWNYYLEKSVGKFLF